MQLLQTPTREPTEFHRLCDGVEEFEPLPDRTRPGVTPKKPDDDQLTEDILACLISPV